MNRFVWFLFFLVLNFGALGIGGLLMNSGPSSNWYVQLNKAPWTPPGWMFGVAWTIIMICFSGYLAYLKELKPASVFWIVFFIQLVLNITWNYIFLINIKLVLG